jgi:hypothetical protein
MAEQENKPDQQIDMSIYGKQGNEGQYGLGQYDSEGNPDPHGLQAQQIEQGSYHTHPQANEQHKEHTSMADKHANAREQLLDLIDKKAFDPVLKASPDTYASENEKKKLQDVQATTRSTQQSYHSKYKTAQAVRENFQRDLNSEAAKKVHRELQSLDLPTLNDIKDEFEQLADKLDVGH